MFITLTRFDNRPVWLNASFIVTVEPRRDGNGAVVVPTGTNCRTLSDSTTTSFSAPCSSPKARLPTS